MPLESPSPSERRRRIRLLDAAGARDLVAAHQRPLRLEGNRLAACGNHDASTAAAGTVSLGGPPDSLPSPDVPGYERTHLDLNGLRRLPLSVARELAHHTGYLSLDGLEEITDAVAAVLGGHAGGGLSLDGVPTLSSAAAESLGRHPGELSLNAVRELDGAAALGLCVMPIRCRSMASRRSVVGRLPRSPGIAATCCSAGSHTLRGRPPGSSRVTPAGSISTG